MKRFLCFTILLLVAVVTAGAQPTPLLSAGVLSGSGNPDFDRAPEQTSGPVVYDVSGDGAPEAIVTGRINIWAFDYASQNTPVLRLQVRDGYEFCSPVTICHLTADEYPWIVVGASTLEHHAAGNCPFRGTSTSPNCHFDGDCYHWHSMIHAWKIVGTDTIWGGSADISNERLTTPVAADVDGDGVDELCFTGSDSYGIYGLPYVRSTVGTHFYNYDNGFTELGSATACEIPWGMQNYLGASEDILQIGQTIPAAGDLDGDGKPEFVVQCLWRITAYTFSSDGQAPTVYWADSTLDGATRSLPVLTVKHAGVSSGLTQPWHFADFTENNELKHGWDGSRIPGPVLADVDGNGHLAVFVQTNEGGPYIWKFNPQGGIPPRYNLNLNSESLTGTELAIGDDQGSGYPHLFGTVLNLGVTGSPLRTWRWYGFDLGQFGFDVSGFYQYDGVAGFYPSGDMHTPAVLPSEVGPQFAVDFVAKDSVKFQRTDIRSQQQWSLAQPGGPVQSNITATDFDGDGHLDYVLSSREHIDMDDYTQLYVYPTNLPFNPETNEWSGYRNGPAHNGLYAQPVGGTQTLTNAKWSGRIVVTSDYTVPSDHILTIEPGTVVEFKSGANLVINGVLMAVGASHDSIYFKADGAAAWGSIILEPKAVHSLDYCVIHGGSGIDSRLHVATIRHCRIEAAKP